MGTKNNIELDLSMLPQDKNGNVLWKDCVGELIPFIYNNEVDYLKVVGYQSGRSCKQQVTLELNGRIRRFHVRDVYYGHIEPLIGVYTQQFLHDVGDVIGDGEYKVIEQIFIVKRTKNTENKQLQGKQERRYRGYRVECLTCGKEHEVEQKKIHQLKCEHK